jgi:hypothetical protein
MKANARKAMNELKKMGVPVFERSDIEYFGISAEEEDSYKWLDYWGEYRGNCVWVNEEIENVLDKYDLFAEWENPGYMVVYDA